MRRKLIAFAMCMLLLGTTVSVDVAAAAERPGTFAPQDESAKQANVLPPKQAEKVIAKRAKEVITAIKQKDMKKLIEYVHPDKGVRFSPYTYVDTKSDLVFTPDQVEKLMTDPKVYTWGSYDGSGESIDLRFRDYYKTFVYDRDFANPEQIGYNQIIGKGNTINNIRQAYPNAIVVEYHFSGSEKLEGMDWSSVRFVYQQKDNQWYLVGIVHDQWTI